jgi:hypothetical protein
VPPGFPRYIRTYFTVRAGASGEARTFAVESYRGGYLEFLDRVREAARDRAITFRGMGLDTERIGALARDSRRRRQALGLAVILAGLVLAALRNLPRH